MKTAIETRTQYACSEAPLPIIVPTIRPRALSSSGAREESYQDEDKNEDEHENEIENEDEHHDVNKDEDEDEDDDEGDDEHDDEDEIDKRATWAKGCRNSLNHTHTPMLTTSSRWCS